MNLARPYNCPTCNGTNVFVDYYRDEDQDSTKPHIHSGHFGCQSCGTAWDAQWECTEIKVTRAGGPPESDVTDLETEYREWLDQGGIPDDPYDGGSNDLDSDPYDVDTGPAEPREEVECPVCDGTLSLLGNLGGAYWYRCENCGVDVPQNLVAQFDI